MPERLNEDVAGRLEEVAYAPTRKRLAPPRSQYGRLSRPVSDILELQGVEGLQALPGIGESIARAIRDLAAMVCPRSRKSSTWTVSTGKRRKPGNS